MKKRKIEPNKTGKSWGRQTTQGGTNNAGSHHGRRKGNETGGTYKGRDPEADGPGCRKPPLLWQVERLKENEITDIIMVIGHLGNKIKEYFGDGENGVSIRHFEETEPGTAGSFYYLKDMIHGDRFVMMSGDLFFDIDFQRMIRFHEEKVRWLTLFVHPNGHPFDSDLSCPGQR